ncbi:MAG: FtsX-like permease family protein [Candidatus Dormibacteraeota bacterium]|nr:FtsX-like permease family protein [Candidatus Dormibacteraeota bacterium]
MGKLGLYFRYGTRSLRRGGQRTLLGIFCIAVGVMAVVALRLAGDMINATLTTNVREDNGGDVSVVSTALPLTPADLTNVSRLQQEGVIEQYLAIGVQRATLRRGAGRTFTSTINVLDDPSRYPLVGDPGFSAPPNGTFAGAVSGRGIVLTQFLASSMGVAPGDTVHMNLVGGNGIDVRVGAVIASGKSLQVGSTAAYISGATFHSVSTQPESYGLVLMTTATDAKASQAASALQTDFPTATVQTVQQALTSNVQAASQVTQYLEIIGLLALAIGGIGIVNTLQVMLSRRRVEIAMLKATGYRRIDLYAMFGIEVGILGLIGGVLGTAAGVAMSLLVKVLIENVINAPLVFEVSAGALLTGVAVGVVTSLIFGLLPIVRAAGIRPQEVLRDLPEGSRVGSRAQVVGLYALVAALFIGLSATILGDFFLALQVVLYSIIGLLILAGVFSVILLIIGYLPVPERFSAPYVISVAAAVAVAAAITVASRGVGVALLVATASGFIVVLLPRSQRTVVKLALRSIGRSRARTSGTLVALFAGVFTIGLILIVGQDISSEISNALSNLASYNVFVIASSQQASAAEAATQNLTGAEGRRVTQDLSTRPISVNGQPFAQSVGPAPAAGSGPGGEREAALFELTGVEGYNLGDDELPNPPLAPARARVGVSSGRELNQSDAGSNNVMVVNALRDAPLNMRVGDQIVVENTATNRQVTLNVVGFYALASRTNGSVSINFFFQPILADRGVVTQLGSENALSIVALKLNPDHKAAALRSVQSAVPGATVLDLADLGALVQQVLGNLVDLLIGIASLALFAGIVIIANTVALAMLERRREIGILKATGYTSRSVLSQVLLENGIVGGIGAIAGMAAVSGATALLGSLALKTSLAVSTPTVLVIIAGVILLSVIVAALVAWRPTRVRPLEVLRYE